MRARITKSWYLVISHSQVLYETHQLREIDLPFGSFVIMSTGNRYNKDRLVGQSPDLFFPVLEDYLHTVITALGWKHVSVISSVHLN